MESEVEAHIDQMIKLCLEKLSMGMKLDATAKFEATAKLYMKNDPIIIDTPAVDTLEQVFNEVENGLILAVKPLVTQVAASAGRVDLPLLAGATVADTIKLSKLDLKSAIISNAVVSRVNQTDFINVDVPVVVGSSLQSLCYQLTFDASAAVEIMTLVLGTEIRHSLGVWYNGTTLSAKVKGTLAQKFIAAETIVSILQEATGKLIKVLYPDNAGVVVEASDMNIAMKRYRLLNEMDDLTLAELDDMTLGELDYVWLTD